MFKIDISAEEGDIIEAFRETHQYDPFFPFLLMHLEKWHYSPHRVFHFHDWYELVYVHRGEGIFLINHTMYDMMEGDLFIVPGNVMHHTNPSKNSPYLVSVILFDPNLIHHVNLGENYFYLQAFEQSRNTDQYRIQLDADLQAALKQLLDRAHAEIGGHRNGYRHRVLNLLHYLLTELNNVYALPQDGNAMRRPSKSETWLKEILVFIDQHITEELSLKRLAQQALVTPEHFSRVFKELTGMNVPTYINMKRIIKARGMIMDQKQSINYISDACGFQSISHFYRTFRKHFHMTPGQYMEKLSMETNP